MAPYAELLEFNQPSPIRREGFTRIRDAFPGLSKWQGYTGMDGLGFHSQFDPERIVEFSGRWDYGEKNAQKLGSRDIISQWMASGEESMIEMAHATFFVECSRVVSHEFVRHRLFSFQQESQRYTKYDEVDPVTMLAWPAELVGGVDNDVMLRAIEEYKSLRARGVSPQIARYVLPNAMLTRMVVSGNLREWRHFLKLRTHKSVQPEMRELALMIYDQLSEVFPTLTKGVISDERAVR